MILSLLCGTSTGPFKVQYIYSLPRVLFFAFPSYFFWRSYFFSPHSFPVSFHPLFKIFIHSLFFCYTSVLWDDDESIQMDLAMRLRNCLKIFVYLLRVKSKKQASKLDRLIWLPFLSAPLLPHVCVTHFQSLTWRFQMQPIIQTKIWRRGGALQWDLSRSYPVCPPPSDLSYLEFLIYVFHPLPGGSCTGILRV